MVETRFLHAGEGRIQDALPCHKKRVHLSKQSSIKGSLISIGRQQDLVSGTGKGGASGWKYFLACHSSSCGAGSCKLCICRVT